MRRLTAAALGGALLAGCNFAPTYKPPLVAVPAAYRDMQIWRTAAPADGAPRPDWWTGFHDPTLDRLEDELNHQNFTLAAASSAFDQARANAAEAIAGLLPELGLEGGIARTQYTSNQLGKSQFLKAHGLNPDFIARNTLAGGVTYEIDFWGQIRNEVAAGKAAAQATGADLAVLRLSLQAELADDYLLLRGLDSEENLLQQTVRAYQQAYDVARNRFTGKISPAMDVTRADAQLESARAQLEDVRARRALAEHAIASLVSVPAPVFTIPPSLKPIALPKLPPSVPSVLLQRRPDVAAAERRVAASNALIGVARAAYFPNIGLNAIGGVQSNNLNLFTGPATFFSLGPTLRLPVFEGGLLRAQEAATIAAYNLSVANYRNTVLTAFQEVEDALAQLHFYGTEAEHDRRAIAAAQRTLDMSMALYQDGATNFLEVVVAQESLLGAQELLLQLETQYLQSGVRLVRALGGGWSERDLIKPGDVPIYNVGVTN
jgi:NodT family efflux transporter outer membrane factor (OMF) lipoprotein